VRVGSDLGGVFGAASLVRRHTLAVLKDCGRIYFVKRRLLNITQSMSHRLIGMGWLRLVGALKVYVSLENIGLFHRSLLFYKTTSPEYHAIDEASIDRYGVATISRRLESIRLFGEYRSLL